MITHTSMGCVSLRWALRSINSWGIQVGTSYGLERIQALSPRTPAWRRTRSIKTQQGEIPLKWQGTAFFVCHHIFSNSLFLTSRGDSVHHGAQLPLPLLRQTSLAESLEMCLHGGVHGQEIALKEATECCGSHFSYLENAGRKWAVKFKRYVVTMVQYPRLSWAGYFWCSVQIASVTKYNN